MASNNKTSYLVSSQVPQFVKDDHPTFITFLEKYYAFLEQQDKTLDLSKRFTENLNVDLADQTFRERLFEQFISLLSTNIVADKTIILKYAKDFYRAKGTENAIRFLVRILHNKEIEFYYPKTDILRASDGKWFIEKSLKITDVAVDNVANSIGVVNFVNKIVRGATTNASAVVESVDIYYDKGELVTELKLTSTRRDFISGERIYTTFTEEGVDRYLSANLFSGSIVNVRIDKPGTGYVVGTSVHIESNTGSGAEIIISKVTTGNLKSVGILTSGAGFQTDDDILITGGGGSGANSYVFQVDNSGRYHPNTYSIVGSTIGLEANTTLGNAVYTNLSSSNANTAIANAFSYWSYSNCGPLLSVAVRTSGNNYSTLPTLDVRSNTVVRSLGILGKMQIVAGGVNYQIGDVITFNNPIGSYGTGALANVTNVSANGSITEVKFKQLPGHIIGGAGYDKDLLPNTTITSANGSGANVIVTAIIGDNESLLPITDTIGAIQQLTIVSPGRGYAVAPTINLAMHGDGTAQATAEIVTGVFTYPGRYINDDGHISAYNFLEDRDYYQNFSYVVKVDQSLASYKKSVIDLAHPSGMKLFGEYAFRDNVAIDSPIEPQPASYFKLNDGTYRVIYKRATYGVQSTPAQYTPYRFGATYSLSNTGNSVYYEATRESIDLRVNNHGYVVGDTVYLSFGPNTSPNLTNTLYTVRFVKNANSFFARTSNVGVNTVNGTVTVYNPAISITPTGGVANGSNIRIVFDTSDPALSNAVYTVRTGNANSMIVVHPNIASAISLSGNANVYTNTVTVTLNSHGYTSNAYLTFSSGDTSNTTNGIYTISGITTNTFNITTSNAVMAGGNVSVIGKKITVNLTNHGFSNTENVQLWFTSGDVANATNGVYSVTAINANSFTINSASFVERGGNTTIYSNNSNIVITKAAHGFASGNLIRMEFASGDIQSIANDVFTVKSVFDANTFNIFHDGIVISNTVTFTETSNTGIVRLGLYT